MRSSRIEDLYSLTPTQEGILFECLRHPEANVYFEQLATTLPEDLDPDAYEAAWRHVIARHPALRTSVVFEDLERPVQVVHRSVSPHIVRLDWSGLDAGERERRYEELLKEDRERGFDLSLPPLLRLTLVRVNATGYLVVWSYHPLILDGWSAGLLLREVASLYGARRAGTAALPPVQPFRSFVDWLQRRDPVAGDGWSDLLRGFREPTPLPGERSNEGTPQIRSGTVEPALPEDEADRLRAFASRAGLTLSTLIQGAWALVLARHAASADVVYGTVVATRPADLPGSRSMVGPLVNTLPVRARIEPAAATLPWLLDLQRRLGELLRRASTPLAAVRRAAEVPGDRPLFESVLVLENILDADFWSLFRPRLFQKTHYPLTVTVVPERDLRLRIDHHHSRVDAATAARLASHLKTMLAGMSEAAEAVLGALPLLGEAERHQLLVEWNDTAVPSMAGPLLPALIRERCESSPDAVAIESETESLTYQQLARRAGGLARRMAALGVGPEKAAAVFVEHSPALLVAALAAWWAGGAYAPLDPEEPLERLGRKLAQLRPAVLVTLSSTANRLPFPGSHTLQVTRGGDCGELEEPPVGRIGRETPAYVLFTSGSTGAPKGVVNVHGAIANRILWMQAAFPLSPADCVLCKTPAGFDVSVWELFWALAVGARVIVARPGGQRDAAYLARLIAQRGVTVAHFVPSLLRAFLEEPGAGEGPRRVFASGERLDREVADRFAERFPGELVNLYGPTEAAIDVSVWRCPRPLPPEPVPIGRPIANLRLYVAAPDLTGTPPGTPGELLIGGAGLARGYLGRPDLTAERFLPDPFGTEPGGRLYRTGDLARHRPDGAIEFLGRIDQQVKIRGHRIEPGEVEAVLSAHPAVRECAVAIAGDERTGPRLVAYVVSAGGGEGLPESRHEPLREHLAERLPAAMVPESWVFLAELPRLASGKVDRRDLPAPPDREGRSGGLPPQTPVQELLVEIWAEVLGLQRVGIRDDFFALGGDSIQSLRIRALAEQAGFRFSLETLLSHRTVERLASQVERGAAESEAPLPQPFGLLDPEDRERVPQGVSDAYPVTALQAGMLFHESSDLAGAVYRDIFLFRLRAPWEPEVFRRVVRRLVARHPTLRTSFDLSGFRAPLQLVWREAEPEVRVEDLSDRPAGDREACLDAWREAERRRPFDPGQPPLVRFSLHRLDAGEASLALSFHHAVLDGWSVAVLVEELARNWAALAAGSEPVLPPAPPPGLLPAFVAMELRAATAEESGRFWDHRLDGLPEPRPPFDAAPPPWGAPPDSRTLTVPVPGEVAAGLARVAREAGVPLKSVLLAAHAEVVTRIAGTSGGATGLVVHGRPDLAGGDRVLGLFLNTVPLRLGREFGSWIGLARRAFAEEIAIFPHRRVPLAHLQRRQGGRPLFATVFDYNRFSPYAGLGEGGGTVQLLGVETFERTEFALYAAFRNAGGAAISLELRVDRARLKGGLAERAAGYYARALEEVALRPENPPEQASLLGPSEAHALLVDWAAAREAAAVPLPIPFAIAERARRHPLEVAVAGAGESLTYAELVAAARSLAARLRRAGSGPGRVVAVAVQRSVRLPVALLGVLGSGAAYLPLDPAHPLERLAWLLADAGPVALVVDRETEAELAELPAAVRLRINEPGDQGPEGALEVAPEDPAYLLYTSGSTGRPKGVLVSHGALANLLQAAAGLAGLSPGRELLAVTTPSFDIAALEIFAPLVAGARVRIASAEEAADATLLRELLAATRPDVLQATPATWRGLLNAGWPGGAPRVAFCGGEALTPDLAGELLRRCPEVWNLYGPTEATVWATAQRLSDSRAPVSIGRPLDNVCAYVLDDRLIPVPAGVAGELYLGGEGVAAGYPGLPGQTAGVFLPAPWSGRTGGRMYRTGDLVRWLPSGELEFLGRADRQIKIRGFRVEPSEVEAVLAGHSAVAACAVVALAAASGERRLVAYVVPKETETRPEPAELRSFMAASLPAYLVPSIVIPLAALPRTPSGKLDTAALPSPEDGRSAGREAPATPAERALAALWKTVLQVGEVGRHENFLELGGDSISAIVVAAKARSAGLALSPAEVLEAHSLAELAQAARPAPEGTVDQPSRPAPPEDRAFALTPLQHGMLLHALEAPHRGLYIEQVVCSLRGELDPARFEEVWRLLALRHGALRTRLLWKGLPEPLQEVTAAATLAVLREDWRSLPGEAREARLKGWLAADRERGFDLETAPLSRLALFQTREDLHLLVWTFHHLILDGWSAALVLAELLAGYGVLQGRRSWEPSPVRPFSDLLAFLENAGEEGEAFWRRELRGLTEPTALTPDHPAPRRPAAASARCELHLSASRTEALRRAAQEGRLTLSTVLQGAWSLLLARASGREDVLFGVVSSGRPAALAGVETMVGPFAATLPARVEVAAGRPVTGWLRDLQARQIERLRHEHTPLTSIRSWSEIAPGLPLFETLLAVETYPVERVGSGGAGLALEAVEVHETLSVPLALVAVPGERLVLRLLHDPEQLSGIAARRLLIQLETLLETLLGEPERPLDELPSLPAAERHQILWEWSGPAVPGDGAGVLNLIERRAREAPDRPALIDAREVVTRSELERRSNRLARALLRLGLKPEDRVAVLVEDSSWLAAAPLAVWKAGGAYVPLDPTYPGQRLAAMIEGSKAALVLTLEHLLPLVPAGAPVVWALDAPPEALPREGDDPLPPRQAPDSLAYVVFTSGSTGRPKGVAVPHRGLSSLVRWHLETYGVTPGDRVSQLASPAFDAAVWEIWPALAAGAAVHLDRTEALRSGEDLGRWLADRGITLAFAPTPLAELLLQAGLPPDAALRALWTGGDRLRLRPGKEWPCPLFNHYGPTEAAVVATAGRVGLDGERAPSLGRSISGVRAYVVGRDLQPVPLGSDGELWIGGEGLARGYLGDPGSTAERFFPDPFSTSVGARLYRTGDRVRWLDDGRLEFRGRIDRQVKVRGVRVEPAEIERVLEEHAAIHRAVVTLRDRVAGGQILVAYVAAGALEGPGPAAGLIEELRDLLRGRLPDVMVPADVVILPELPLTANGKIDLAALPEPGRARTEDGGAEGRPLTGDEAKLAALWAEVLGVPKIRPTDSFFELGGHSLLALHLASRIRETFGVELPLAGLLREPTLERLAQVLRCFGHAPAAVHDAPPRVEGESERDFPLTDVQRFLLERRPADRGANVHFEIEAQDGDGTAADRLAAALRRLVARHAMLRAEVLPEGSQRIRSEVPPLDLGLEHLEAGDVEDRLHRERLRLRGTGKVFGAWPLFTFRAFRLPDRRLRLLGRIDSLLADGWSRWMLVAELADLLDHPGRELEPLACTYRDFALAQERAPSPRDLAYWAARSEALAPPAALPWATDAPGSLLEGREAPLLDAGRWAGLKEEAARSSSTPTGLLLAAFCQALAPFCGDRPWTLGLVGSFRPPIHPQIHQVVGNFNTLIPIVCAPEGASFEQRLQAVRHQVSEALDHWSLSGYAVLDRLRTKPGWEAGELPVQFNSLLEYSHPIYRQGAPGAQPQPPTVRLLSAGADLPGVLLVPTVVEGQDGDLRCRWQALEGAFPPGFPEEVLASFSRQLARLHTGAISVTP